MDGEGYVLDSCGYVVVKTWGLPTPPNRCDVFLSRRGAGRVYVLVGITSAARKCPIPCHQPRGLSPEFESQERYLVYQSTETYRGAAPVFPFGLGAQRFYHCPK